MYKFAAIVLILASPAIAQQQQPAPQSSAQQPKPKERTICRMQEEIGSRLGGKRVCMTASQWAEQQRLDREAVEDAQRRALPSQ